MDASDRKACLESAQRHFVEARDKAARICSRIDYAIVQNQIQGSSQLLAAVAQVKASVQIAATRVDQLSQAEADGFDALKTSLDDSWEDLARSMQRVVSRFP